ncbi:beta-Ala-His dipeptidase-like isoform X2 [Cimex lectularius]|uniref:Uncharacterized protein n=1 Tax=Cimex lectularius TaxID=79782 RepID=A0A8I6SP42_CIMLE|nr:beta-Ala-His dipeptidase-like isoform X2 [Cimex lectularius]XP_024085633.1 beta-Ala-His dipeptidase-like isoform X2 [Cimex lectularius]
MQGKGARPSKGSAQQTNPWVKGIKDHLKASSQTYEEYFREIMKKKEIFMNDCKTGRTNFLNWLADTLRGVGLYSEQVKMPGNPLSLYGPEDCPNALLAWNTKQVPKKWTLCVIGNFDIAEPQLKEASLLMDGRYIPPRYKPENWGILAAWLSALRTISSVGLQWPINFKLVWTANQADDSVALIKFVKEQKHDFFLDVDFFCTCTTLSKTSLPAGIVYGCRGACHFVIEVSEGRSNYCTCETGPARQAYCDMMMMLDDLQKDCVYTYLNVVEPFRLPQRFKKIMEKVYIRDLTPELGYWYRSSILKQKVYNFPEMWKPEVKLQSINEYPKHGHLFTPGTVVARFSVKYMSETAPSRVEEMVSRLLRKKWDRLGSNLSCKLSMDYWSRPWVMDCDNQLLKYAKRAVCKSFHTLAVESFDFTPNPLPAVLELIVGKDTVYLSLASMLDIGKPTLRKNFMRNVKSIIIFINILQKATTHKEYTKVYNKRKLQTKEIRSMLNDLSHVREKTQPYTPEETKERNQFLDLLHVL